MKFYPSEKGGGGEGEVLAMLKRGHKSFGVVFTQLLEVLAILNGGGGAKNVSALLKEGREQFYPVLRWG